MIKFFFSIFSFFCSPAIKLGKKDTIFYAQLFLAPKHLKHTNNLGWNNLNVEQGLSVLHLSDWVTVIFLRVWPLRVEFFQAGLVQDMLLFSLSIFCCGLFSHHATKTDQRM